MAHYNVQKTFKKKYISLEEFFFWKQWLGNCAGIGDWIVSPAYPLLWNTFITFPSALIIKYSTNLNLIIAMNLSLCYLYIYIYWKDYWLHVLVGRYSLSMFLYFVYYKKNSMMAASNSSIQSYASSENTADICKDLQKNCTAGTAKIWSYKAVS